MILCQQIIDAAQTLSDKTAGDSNYPLYLLVVVSSFVAYHFHQKYDKAIVKILEAKDEQIGEIKEMSEKLNAALTETNKIIDKLQSTVTPLISLVQELKQEQIKINEKLSDNSAKVESDRS